MDADVLQEVLVQFRNREDAARQGLIKGLDNAGQGRVEWGGAIFFDPVTGTYYLSGGGPHEGEKDEIRIVGRKQKADDTLAGAYHTHPPQDKGGMFSGQDTSVARSIEQPFYMGQAFDRTGHVFDASNEPRRQRGSVKVGGPSRGKEFMPGMLMVREDPSVLDADKRARDEQDRSQALVAEILRKPR